MNEKIKELMMRAIKDMPETYYWPGQYVENFGQYVEKFAELIVKECATAFEAEVDSWKEMDPYQGSIKRQGTKAIKQHFGVEE